MLHPLGYLFAIAKNGRGDACIYFTACDEVAAVLSLANDPA
jgi:hypothetical protein